MELREHQNLLVNQCKEILTFKHLCYLAAEERVGKSLVALELIYQLCNINEPAVIVTKKKAIQGWQESIDAYKDGVLNARVLVTNYEQLRKVRDLKAKFVVLDEAHHGIGAYPRTSKTAEFAQDMAYDAVYVLLMSATPHAESYSQLFHQFNVSMHSPFDKYRTFYEWFKDFGILEFQWIAGRQIRKYNKTQEDKILSIVEPYFVRMSREQAGFEFAPNDKLHYVELSSEQKKAIEEVERSKVFSQNGTIIYEADTPLKQILALHQIEGGTLKLDKRGWNVFTFEQNPKIEYIKQRFGDTDKLAIFYNYIAEGEILRKSFQNALILQGTSYAEGIDLSHIETLVIFSQNFSASKYIQRRARQCNYQRKDPIVVHFILVKDCVSESVYDSVARKNVNFTAKHYQRISNG